MTKTTKTTKKVTDATLIQAGAPACDICVAEFPHSAPNVARYDGQLSGAQCWAFACVTHRSALVAPSKLRIEGYKR